MPGSDAARVVLVVEDEALLRMAIVDGLSDAGFETLEAADAEEALEILGLRHDVVAVFTDINMPGSMDGIALAHAVRRRWPPVMLILTSGKATPQADMLPSGSLFFPKPYDSSRVADALRETVGSG